MNKMKIDGHDPFGHQQGWHRVIYISIELAARMLGEPHFGAFGDFPNKGFAVVGLDPTCPKVVAIYREGVTFQIIINERKEVFAQFEDEYLLTKDPQRDLWPTAVGSIGTCRECGVKWRIRMACPNCGETVRED